jgi:hypothetical protein
VDEPHDVIGGNTNAKFFENGQGGQITGMFYGIEKGVVTPGNPFPGTSGYLDLYWRDASLGAVATANAAPTIRTDFSHATGYTDGDFLARIKFDTGMDPVSSTNTIVGTAVPTTSRFSGFADSYGSVDMTAGGLWAQKLNSDWFVTPEGNRDLRFKNSYNNNARWNGAPGSNIVGANVDDPGQAFALPEPGALSLMGLSMLGMGAVLRRRQKSAK